jgi:5'(3')-deoxyribonucleotidase
LKANLVNSPTTHIFLDMDGVLTDFVSACLTLHGQPQALETWPAGNRDIPQVVGISKSDFWRLIDDQGAEFWAGLKPFPWCDDLVALVREFAPLTILTAPSLSPACLDGKVRWLYEHFPKVRGKRFTDFLIGNQKHLLAQAGRVLIDDTESHVDAFRAAGGEAILFPQPWNANHAITDRLAYVRSQLSTIVR